jgi:hypothetical protein
MIAVIAGSRTIRNAKLIYETLDIIHAGLKLTEVISGGAPGPDRIGAAWAVDNNLHVKWMYAQWETYGKAAGYIRNTEMAEYAANHQEPATVVAFWNGQSRGTANMIDLANKFDLEKLIISAETEDWLTPVQITGAS